MGDMIWLSIFDSQVLHMVAETSIIVIGSLLMGIFLAYLHWSGYKKRMRELDAELKIEREKLVDLNNQITYLNQLRDQLTTEISEEKSRHGIQSKQLYDQSQKLYQYENDLARNQSLVEQLNASIASYEQRLKIIESEIARAESTPVLKAEPQITPTRANYERVSEMLGKPVTENDLTIVSGIGTRTASLLQAHGKDTWNKLGETQVDTIMAILSKAGGVYKALDPSYWPKQALMAANSEWRKL